MKQTKLNQDEHIFNDVKGRMLSEYKKAVEQYKADIAAGKVKAPEFHEFLPIAEEPPITSTHNERKETEQARLS